MKRVAIIGLGWLGMPLAASLLAQGCYKVVGSKTRPEGIKAARISGITCYKLNLTPFPEGDADELASLFQVDALVITLPASRTLAGAENYFLAVQHVVKRALSAAIPRIIFTSSTAVYGENHGVKHEGTPTSPCSPAGICLVELENWLYQLPNTSVDILRLSGLVGPGRHPGRFLAGQKSLSDGGHGVNLVHVTDVINAITLLLQLPQGGYRYNLCAPRHPVKRDYYPAMARVLGMSSPPVYLTENDGARGGKIIDGSRICKELGFKYRYPDPVIMPIA
ncbi:SDR family oxidoreductase [secondary endosymbiont of Ctenarytaina eucalypti]|nr:SDR family oxidoreductase [secondary endosymbiont of Ctenarytaina eucalypti]